MADLGVADEIRINPQIKARTDALEIYIVFFIALLFKFKSRLELFADNSRDKFVEIKLDIILIDN